MVFWSALKRKIKESFTRKEFDAEAVKLTGAQTIQGAKTFTNVVKAAAPVANNDLTTKQYVDSKAYDADNVYSKTESDARYFKVSATANINTDNTANTIIKANIVNLTSKTGDLELRVNAAGKSVNINNKPITGLAPPTGNDHATTKKYVDDITNSLTARVDNNQELINQNIADIGTKANANNVVDLSTNQEIAGEKRFTGVCRVTRTPTVDLMIANKKYVDDKFNSAGQFDPNLYYDKTASDNRYYQKSQVYTKTESDNRYYQKSQVYTKSETDSRLNNKANNSDVVKLSGNQTISGEKRFNSYIVTNGIKPPNSDGNTTIAFVSGKAWVQVPAKEMDVNGCRITYLGTPTNSNDAATKAYADTHLIRLYETLGVALPADLAQAKTLMEQEAREANEKNR